MLKLADLASDPQVLANGYIAGIEHPALGQVNVVGVPVRFSGTPASAGGCAPEFGQHTEEVLMEWFGFGWEELQRLREDEII